MLRELSKKLVQGRGKPEDMHSVGDTLNHLRREAVASRPGEVWLEVTDSTGNATVGEVVYPALSVLTDEQARDVFRQLGRATGMLTFPSSRLRVGRVGWLPRLMGRLAYQTWVSDASVTAHTEASTGGMAVEGVVESLSELFREPDGGKRAA